MTSQFILMLSRIILSIVEGLILLRIVLRLFGARTTAPFVQWVYDTTAPLLSPFAGMFPTTTLPNIPFAIEYSALFALLVYAFIGYLIQELLLYISSYRRRSDDEEVQEVRYRKRR